MRRGPVRDTLRRARGEVPGPLCPFLGMHPTPYLPGLFCSL